MRPRLQKCIRLLPWLLLLTIGFYLVLGEGWKDVTLGRFHRKAQGMFADVGGVTEARIYLLMGTNEQQTQETFPIRPYGTTEPVCGSITLTGQKLGAFLDLWSWQSPAQWRQALCHEPAYGFRLYRGNNLVAETSVCWECSNFYVEVWPFGSGWYGFDADSKIAKDLLNYCDSLLPYARAKDTQARSTNE